MKLNTNWGTVTIDPAKVSAFTCRIDPSKPHYEIELFFDAPSSIVVATIDNFDELLKCMKELYFSSINK